LVKFSARVLVLVYGLALSAPVVAQAPQASAALSPFRGAVVIAGEWQQAVAMPLNRDAMHSASAVVSYRMPMWAVDAGWLRVARDLSTVQGGMISAGPTFAWRMIHFLPQVGGFVGKSYASADTTGYQAVGPGGVDVHQARYSYSEATSLGGGVLLAIEAPIYRTLNARVSGSEWLFSGAPLATSRARAIVGVGLSLQVWK
jgi:hypothetical protein